MLCVNVLLNINLFRLENIRLCINTFAYSFIDFLGKEIGSRFGIRIALSGYIHADYGYIFTPIDGYRFPVYALPIFGRCYLSKKTGAKYYRFRIHDFRYKILPKIGGDF